MGAVGIGDMMAGFGFGAVAGALVMLRVRPRSRPVAAAMGVFAGQFGAVPAFASSGAPEVVAAALCLVPALRRGVS
jgi:hypothetical protein